VRDFHEYGSKYFGSLKGEGSLVHRRNYQLCRREKRKRVHMIKMYLIMFSTTLSVSESAWLQMLG
jgi:hypothetical protein